MCWRRADSGATWLNGMSDGLARQIERLLEVAMSTGAEAINVIPDRNHAGVKDEKLTNLYAVVAVAESLTCRW